MNDIFEEVIRLKEELEQEKRLRSEWQEKYYELMNELKKTQALLRQFLNENTPSSKLPFKVKMPDKKEQKPRGKPHGSNGATKEEPKNIDRKISATLEGKCPRCGKIIHKRNIEKRIRYVYDAKIIPEIIEVEEEFYPCDCGEFCTGKHPEIPQRGMIGYNLQTLFTEMKFNFSASYANISTFFDKVTDGKINFSPLAINNCIVKVSEKLESSYNEMESRIKNESFAYSDETSWPVNGVRWYLWMIITSNYAFITIQNSRAKRVLLDIFGEKYHGGIISDCYKVYNGFAEWFQKCWAHLVRKAKFESEKNPRKNVRKLYEQLSGLYEEMKDFLKENPSIEIRIKKKIEFEKKLDEIINYKYWCAEAKSIIKNRINAYKNQWLTAIEIEGVSLDNNICERKIRGSIGWRKMLGGHKTREGTKQYAIIQTHRMTWRHQEKNSYNQLLNAVRN
jgi:transposase